MKVPIPLNDLDQAIMAFQRSQAALPDLLRHLRGQSVAAGAVSSGGGQSKDALSGGAADAVPAGSKSQTV